MCNKTICFLLSLLLLGVVNFADEIVLQNGYNGYEGCTDTYIKINGDGIIKPFLYHNKNYHSEIKIETANCDGCDFGTYARALYKFDLSSTSVSSDEIKKATFSSYFWGGFTDNGEKTHLYRITKEWKVEEATWVNAKNGEMWNPEEDTLGQGGTFTEEDASETDYAESENWEEYDITQILKYFLYHPEENYGFIIISDEDFNNTQRVYISSDYTEDTSLRPKLTIEGITAITHSPQKSIKNKINLKITNRAISFSLLFNNSLVTVSNAKGRKIISLRGSYKNSHEIPLSKLSTGVHFLNIKHDNRSETLKFFVMK